MKRGVVYGALAVILSLTVIGCTPQVINLAPREIVTTSSFQAEEYELANGRFITTETRWPAGIYRLANGGTLTLGPAVYPRYAWVTPAALRPEGQ